MTTTQERITRILDQHLGSCSCPDLANHVCHRADLVLDLLKELSPELLVADDAYRVVQAEEQLTSGGSLQDFDDAWQSLVMGVRTLQRG